MKRTNKFSGTMVVAAIMFGIGFGIGITNIPPRKAQVDQTNLLEDLKEWVKWDIEEGRVNNVIGVTYLEAIESGLDKTYK